MNYGEEYGYWYLRLNGFFPLQNFVIHKSGEIQHSSDCDLLAVRPPYVFEEIGGKPEDWDSNLLDHFSPNTLVGVICEVKTGDFRPAKLFSDGNVAYSLYRLGLVPVDETRALADKFRNISVLDLNENHQVAKLLISNKSVKEERFLSLDLGDVIEFLYARVERYPEDKYRDRMFFSSVLIQSVFDMATLRKATVRSASS